MFFFCFIIGQYSVLVVFDWWSSLLELVWVLNQTDNISHISCFYYLVYIEKKILAIRTAYWLLAIPKSYTKSLKVSINPLLAAFSSISKNLCLSLKRVATLYFTFVCWGGITPIGGLAKWGARSPGGLYMGGGTIIPLSPKGGIPPMFGGSIMPGGWTRGGGIIGLSPPTIKLGRFPGRGYWLGGLLLSLRLVSVCFLIFSSVSFAFR